MTTTPIELVLSKLPDAKKNGNGWAACCPAHDDNVPSLSIAEGDDGRVLLLCHTGCSIEKICESLGLQVRDLMPGNLYAMYRSTEPPNFREKQQYRRQDSEKPKGSTYQTIDEAIKSLDQMMASQEGRRADVWRYVDANGDLVAAVVRYDQPTPEGEKQRKTFRPVSKHSDGWKISDPPDVWPLYQLADLVDADQVYINEGEKAADAASSIGLIATTSAHGSGSAHKSDWSPLVGKHCFILPDNNDAGANYAAAVKKELEELSPPAHVTVVELPDLPDGGDIYDWIEARKSNKPESLKEEIESLAEATDSAPLSDGPPPVPLNTIRVPPMRSDILDGWLSDMVEAVSQATETPRELPTLIGIGVLATACQKRFTVMPEEDYFEPLNIWGACVLPSGHRKSAVVVRMNRPLFDWQEAQARLLEPKIKRIESERTTAEVRIKALRQKAGRQQEKFKYEEIRKEIEELEDDLPEIPICPVLFTADVTPEHLGTMLSQQGERMSILSDESGIFDLMAGRYSNGIPNLDVWLQSHSGTPVRVDRGCRPPVYCRHPALTISISPQPDVLRGLASHKEFRGRGLLARFLYCLPVSKIGYRTLEHKAVPKRVSDAYAEAINAILDSPVAVTDDGVEHPRVLKFSKAAWKLWKSEAKRAEIDMRPGGRFEHMTDWAGKYPGAVARIAGLLHVAEHVERSLEHLTVAEATMARAIKLGSLLAEHALLAFDLVGCDPAWEGSRMVWSWIEREKEPQFCKRDCWHPLRGTFKRVVDIDPSLEVLVETGHINRQKSPRKGPGPKGEWFEVNPVVVEAWKSGSNYYPKIDDQNDRIVEPTNETWADGEESGHSGHHSGDIANAVEKSGQLGHDSEDLVNNDEWGQVP